MVQQPARTPISDLMHGLFPASSNDPVVAAQRPAAGNDSRKSVSADCVEGHRVNIGSRGQEVRTAYSEHNTLGGPVTSSLRHHSRRASRNHRRRPAAASKQRHVTESPWTAHGVTSSRNPPEPRDATSSGISRETPAVTSSSGNSREPRHVTESPGTSQGPQHGMTSLRWNPPPQPQGATSSGIFQESPAVTSSSGNIREPCGPVTSTGNISGTLDLAMSSGISDRDRGRPSCKHNAHLCRHRTESPAVTSSRKPQESPTGLGPRQEDSPSRQASSDAAKKLGDRCWSRSNSAPPSFDAPQNPFSPLLNFLFSDPQKSANWSKHEDDDDEQHVCNTVRSPRTEWFGSSTVIANICLSTRNRLVAGVWSTAVSQMTVGSEKQTNDDEVGRLATADGLLASPIDPRLHRAGTRQVGTA